MPINNYDIIMYWERTVKRGADEFERREEGGTIGRQDGARRGEEEEEKEREEEALEGSEQT